MFVSLPPPFFSPGCARRVKRCLDCRAQITVKEGLREFNVLVAIPSDLAVFLFPAMETSGGGSPGSSGPNCAICLTEPRNTALLCGHQLCWDCAQKVDHCPVCRKFITHRIRLFQ